MLKRKVTDNIIRPAVITVWAPGGNNTASLSAEIAKVLSGKNKTLLAEMPCMGLPRIYFETRKKTKYIDHILSDFERTGSISIEYQEGDDLLVLPINNIAIPDSPVTMRIELETLIKFPEALVKSARLNGIEHILLDCQGQLTTPLTFISLKICNKTFIYINDAYEVNWGMAAIRQLIDDYKMPEDKFVILTENIDELADVLSKKYKLPIIRPGIDAITNYIFSALAEEPEKRENVTEITTGLKIKI